MEMKKFFSLPVRLHGDTIECDEFAYATTSCEYIVDGVDSGEAIVEAINKYDQHVERIAELEKHLRKLIGLGDDFYNMDELNTCINIDDSESVRENFGEALFLARQDIGE